MKYRYLDLRRPRLGATFGCATGSAKPRAIISIAAASSRSRRRSSRTPRRKARAISSCPRASARELLRAARRRRSNTSNCSGRRPGEIFPDRPLFPRRRSARRSPAGVHPDRHRGVVRHSGGHLATGRRPARRHVQGRRAASTFHAVPAHDVSARRWTATASDKPDTRFGMEITDLGDVFAQPVQDLPRHARWRRRGQSDQCQRLRRHHHRPDEAPQRDGHRGRASGQRPRLHQGRERRMEIAARGSSSATTRRRRCRSKLESPKATSSSLRPDKWEIACEVLGRVRLRIAEMQELTTARPAFNFLWVVEFPLLAYGARNNNWIAVHHPFTRPKAERSALLEAGESSARSAPRPTTSCSTAYELGGGSIRIHERDLQQDVRVLGVSPEEQQNQVRPPSRRVPLRRAAARRHRARPRSPRHAHRRRKASAT